MSTDIPSINALDQPAFVATLGHLFEHSPWVAERTWARRPFRDAAHLEVELRATMRAAGGTARADPRPSRPRRPAGPGAAADGRIDPRAGQRRSRRARRRRAGAI